ncbi:MAG: discoidin domain-containing protein [Candidatus Hydrogenedentes bacterium]|nr:discoidin domain-containing protein [Candidatus Hydrogenedentota bacterium]
MKARCGIVCSAIIVLASASTLAAPAAPEIPDGWSWHGRRPFSEIAVIASSEEPDRWPALNAVDGDTSEPEGLWQTLRNSPESAWLELRLREPVRMTGVRIYHQLDAGYYRSVDYSIACEADGAWKPVATVEGNTATGWRDHPFEPIETAAVRIDIQKSEHGFRMGLNEVELVYDAEQEAGPRTVLSEPYRCGDVGELGRIGYAADVPDGASVALSTRTAPDAGGTPGGWCEWSPPYTANPAAIVSPPAEWIQCRAVFTDSPGGRAVVNDIVLGWPACVGTVDLGGVIARPGAPLTATVHFTEPMDTAAPLLGILERAGQPDTPLGAGAWRDSGRIWQFEPVDLDAGLGLAGLAFGGAHTADGLPMLAHSEPFAIGTEPLLARLRAIAAWMMEHPHNAIFVEGYNQRTILGLYEITKEPAYLEHVRKWAQWLLEYQKEDGYWPTGYGDVYFADTGSALGLLINFYKHASPDEQRAIDTALARYAHLLLVRGDSEGKPFVHEDGSLGVGFKADKDGTVTGDLNKPYTISTALTGAEIFAAMYYMYGDEQYKQIAVNACDWLLDTMVDSGQIPYFIEDWNPGGEDAFWVWERWPYDTSAYAGEGFLAAWTYIDDAAFRAELGRRVRPHIEWLLRTQNADGSWARRASGDQLRSHGVVNLLLWYDEHVRPDPRVTAAIRRWCLLVLDEERSAYLRVPGDGIATSLTGRALLEIIRPGVDCYRWKDR